MGRGRGESPTKGANQVVCVELVGKGAAASLASPHLPGRTSDTYRYAHPGLLPCAWAPWVATNGATDGWTKNQCAASAPCLIGRRCRRTGNTQTRPLTPPHTIEYNTAAVTSPLLMCHRRGVGNAMTSSWRRPLSPALSSSSCRARMRASYLLRIVSISSWRAS